MKSQFFFVNFHSSKRRLNENYITKKKDFFKIIYFYYKFILFSSLFIIILSYFLRETLAGKVLMDSSKSSSKQLFLLKENKIKNNYKGRK